MALMTLQNIFVGHTKKGEMIGLFLAMLELIRQKKIAVEQPEPLGDVQIRLREDAADQVLFGELPPTQPVEDQPNS